MTDYDFSDDLFGAMFVIDNKKSVIYRNTSLLRLLNLDQSSLKVGDDGLLIMNGIYTEFGNFCSKVIECKSLCATEFEFLKNGRKIKITINGISNNSGHQIFHFKEVFITFDSKQLKEIGKVAGKISHELNNPLMMAYGNTELFLFALESADLNSSRNELTLYQDNIKNALERINKIISHLESTLYNHLENTNSDKNTG